MYNKIINLSYESGKALRLDDAQGRYSEYLKSTLNTKTKFKNLKVVLEPECFSYPIVLPKLHLITTS